MTELERTKRALSVAKRCIDACTRCVDIPTVGAVAKEYLALINSILHPPPEMETVPVTNWVCQGCDFVLRAEPGEENEGCCHNTNFVKLTGSYQRLKKQPVEKSVTVEAYVTPEGEIKRVIKGGYTHYPIFGDRGELQHKNVTLTVIYTG